MMLLASVDPVLPRIEHVSLAAEPDFEETFVHCMGFPER